MKHQLFRIERGARNDQRGLTLYINGIRTLAFNYWSLWRHEKRNQVGWLFRVGLPSRIGYGSAAWQAMPWWRRVIHPRAWMRRTFYVGWRATGGQSAHGPWPKLRIGFAYPNAVPYSFRSY